MKVKKIRLQARRIYLRYFNCMGLSCEYIKEYLLRYIFVNKKGPNKGKTFVKSYIIGEQKTIFGETDMKHYFCLLEFDRKVDLRMPTYDQRGVLYVEDCGARVEKITSYSEFLRTKEIIILRSRSWIADDLSSEERDRMSLKVAESKKKKTLIEKIMSFLKKFFIS